MDPEQSAKIKVKMLAQVMNVELKNPLSKDRYVLTMHAPTGWEFPLPGVVVDYAGDYAFVSWEEALISITAMRSQSPLRMFDLFRACQRKEIAE